MFIALVVGANYVECTLVTLMVIYIYSKDVRVIRGTAASLGSWKDWPALRKKLELRRTYTINENFSVGNFFTLRPSPSAMALVCVSGQ